LVVRCVALHHASLQFSKTYASRPDDRICDVHRAVSLRIALFRVLTAGESAGHFDRSDAALLCRSVRWQITDEDRGKIKRKLIDALENATRPRDIASLSKALIACEAQNQRDDFLLAKQDSRNPEEQELKITVEHVEVDRIGDEGL